MTEELNETRRKQQALLERRMYHLTPAPPKLPPQEYIELYLAEKEGKYLLWYLHDREPMLNKLAQDACQRYGLAEHFRTSSRRRCAVSWPPFKCTIRLSAHRLPLFKSGIYRTVLMITSAQRKAVLSP